MENLNPKLSKMKYAILLLALFVFAAVATHAQPEGSIREITSGTHYCHHENGNDEWFIYRPDSPTWVILTSVGKTDTDTYVEVYHEGDKNPFLRSDDYQDAQSMVKFVAEPDSNYYIKWRGIYAETGYDWDCIEKDLDNGEHFSTAIEVTDKTMQFQISQGNDVWYKYVCDGDQWLGMESSFPDYRIYQIRGDEMHLIQSAYAPFRNSFSFSPREGEVYYFHWKNEVSSVVNLSWKLTPNTLQEGKSSEMPEELPMDQLTRFNPQAGIDHWYKFKGDSIGQLKIVDNNYGNMKVEVWEQHSGLEVQVNFAKGNWAPDYYYFHYKKDIEYLIRFRHSTGFYFSAEKITTSPGSARQNPKEVEEGVHYAKTRYNRGEWFRYIPNVTGEVMIATQYGAFAETTIHLLEEASGLLLATDTTENHNDKEGSVVFNAEQSVSYLIYIGNSSHSSIDGIYWDLRLNPHFCSAPDPISALNTNTLMGNTDYWFEYTASKRSKVSVAVSGLEDKEQYVDIEFYRSCDTFIEAGKDAAEIFMNGGEKVLIKIKGYHIDNFYSIVINETEQTTGTEEFPIEVTIGSHQIQVNKEQWFVYYPQSTGKIEIDMPDDLSPMPPLEIYRPHGNSKYITTRSRNFGKAATRCQPGEPLYIRWFNIYSDVSFEWTITEKEPVPGDLITNALEVKEGMNRMTKTNRMPNWYYHVPQSLGNITISTCGLTTENTFISVYHSINQIGTSIFNGDACGSQAEIRFDCHPNDTVYFVLYEDYSNSPYDFLFSETPSVAGSERRNAHEAILGTNVAAFTEANVQWYQYKASREGRLILSNCGIETSFLPEILVYKNSSDWEENIESKGCGVNQKTIEFNIRPGHTYYIKFQSGASGTGLSMEWNLEEATFAEGTRCDNPIIIDEGLHTSNSEAVWFSYTAKSNAEITLSRCHIADNVDLYLNPRIYKNCGQLIKRVEDTYCGTNMEHSFVALKDSTYLISWGSFSDDQVRWELSESTYPTNGYCLEAKEVARGINHAEHIGNHDVWYKFTPPHDGNIILNSVGLTQQDTEVVFLSGCSDGVNYTEIYSNDSYLGYDQSQLSYTCEANETYYIQWKGDKVTAPYDWEFTYVAKGDDKEDPLEARLGENERTVTDSTSQFFSFGNNIERHFYEITIPREEGKIRKLNVYPKHYSSNDGFYFNADSTQAEIQRPYGGSYIIECICEPGDSFTWTIEERYIDTLAVNTRLSGHSGFINDWFILTGEDDAFYTIESDQASKANSDIQLFADYVYNDSKLSPITSELEVVVYQLFENKKHYIKWASPKTGSADYWWSLTPYHLSGSARCIDAQPARLGDIHSTFMDYSLMYKMRPEKSGRYIITATSEELQRLGLSRLNLYQGTCHSKTWLGYIDFTGASFDQTLITSIPMDSIDKDTNYYLEWEFDFFRNQIKEFSWHLSFDAEYDLGTPIPDSSYFSISQNPNNGQFEVHFPDLSEQATLEICNISGETIYSEIIQAQTKQRRINISGRPAGVYLITLRNSKYDLTTKFIIQRE